MAGRDPYGGIQRRLRARIRGAREKADRVVEEMQTRVEKFLRAREALLAQAVDPREIEGGASRDVARIPATGRPAGA